MRKIGSVPILESGGAPAIGKAAQGVPGDARAGRGQPSGRGGRVPRARRALWLRQVDAAADRRRADAADLGRSHSRRSHRQRAAAEKTKSGILAEAYKLSQTYRGEGEA